VRWRLTFFGPGETPDFSAYDVLVTQSSLFDEPDADYSGLLANRAAITAARGSRTLITGLDPDFHYLTPVPGPRDDGPRGFLVNAVNWAGSGTGLGIVALDEEESQWMVNADSFLLADVSGWTRRDFGGPIQIAAFAASYPINAGLTTAGFDWGGHSALDTAMPGYVAIHESGDQYEPPLGLTMVTASEASGRTTPLAGYWCEVLLPPLDRPVTLSAASERRIPMRFVLLDEMGATVTDADLSQPPQAQVRFGSSSQLVGPFQFNPSSDTWSIQLNAGDFLAAGTYTVNAVAGDDSYEVSLCQQTVERL